jgi:hypothetical protein
VEVEGVEEEEVEAGVEAVGWVGKGWGNKIDAREWMWSCLSEDPERRRGVGR